MPARAYGTMLPYGFPGNPSRISDHFHSTRPVNSASAPIYFGDPLILLSDGTVKRADASLTAANFAGVALANAMQNNSYAVNPSGVSTLTTTSGFYMPYQPCSFAERDHVTVTCKLGTPTAGGPVYVRKALNAGTYPSSQIGDWEAIADGTNNVQITNCSWRDNRKDADNIAELRIKTINT